ncbi:hypothetical protein C7S13_1967 [Burkholderia cepacia]|nr:hypothetical protein [Burkholderia cepacia]
MPSVRPPPTPRGQPRSYPLSRIGPMTPDMVCAGVRRAGSRPGRITA